MAKLKSKPKAKPKYTQINILSTQINKISTQIIISLSWFGKRISGLGNVKFGFPT